MAEDSHRTMCFVISCISSWLVVVHCGSSSFLVSRRGWWRFIVRRRHFVYLGVNGGGSLCIAVIPCIFSWLVVLHWAPPYFYCERYLCRKENSSKYLLPSHWRL